MDLNVHIHHVVRARRAAAGTHQVTTSSRSIMTSNSDLHTRRVTASKGGGGRHSRDMVSSRHMEHHTTQG